MSCASSIFPCFLIASKYKTARLPRPYQQSSFKLSLIQTRFPCGYRPLIRFVLQSFGSPGWARTNDPLVTRNLMVSHKHGLSHHHILANVGARRLVSEPSTGLI